MTNFDVFNGDADGICSLVQLRLAEPRQATLITGVKRDIALLSQVEAKAGDRITVLDISMQKNQADLQRVLAAGAEVFYADHHKAGDIPKHANLDAHIDLRPTACTALIINRYLQQQFALWAVTAAFGDNLENSALALAQELDLTADTNALLKELGLYLNYNGYGTAIEDLFFHPAELYRACVEFASPIDFVQQNTEVFGTLQDGYHADMSRAEQLKLFHHTSHVTAIMLPDEAWARRVSGVFGNELSNRHPDRAHAIITPKGGDYVVSIRAPQNRLQGADEIASQFPTGGGRKGAAGINQLPEASIPQFLDAMSQYYDH